MLAICSVLWYFFKGAVLAVTVVTAGTHGNQPHSSALYYNQTSQRRDETNKRLLGSTTINNHANITLLDLTQPFILNCFEFNCIEWP